jgi:uncharacterized metal-binding protein
MPSGKVHMKIWRHAWLLPICFCAAVSIWGYPIIGALIVIGYFLGRWIDPDLDELGLTSSEGRMMRELKVFGVLLTMLYLPYAYLMRFVGIGRRGHRNFFSHFPVIGTAIRLAWLLMIPGLIAWHYGFQPTQDLIHGLFGVLIGLSIADWLHWAADMCGRFKSML